MWTSNIPDRDRLLSVQKTTGQSVPVECSRRWWSVWIRLGGKCARLCAASMCERQGCPKNRPPTAQRQCLMDVLHSTQTKDEDEITTMSCNSNQNHLVRPGWVHTCSCIEFSYIRKGERRLGCWLHREERLLFPSVLHIQKRQRSQSLRIQRDSQRQMSLKWK